MFFRTCFLLTKLSGILLLIVYQISFSRMQYASHTVFQLIVPVIRVVVLTLKARTHRDEFRARYSPTFNAS